MAVREKNIVINVDDARNLIEFPVDSEYDILYAGSITLKVFQNGSSTTYSSHIIDHGSRNVVIYFNYAPTNLGLSNYELWLEEHNTSKVELLYKGTVEWL